jgi:hypothetical protein
MDGPGFEYNSATVQQERIMTARVNIVSSLAFILAVAVMMSAGQAAFAQTTPAPQTTPSTDSPQSGQQHKHHHKKQQDPSTPDQAPKAE